MSELVIRRAHLQDWVNHCSTEEQILVFLAAMDEEATNVASMKMKNVHIEPSYFGQAIKNSSEQDLAGQESMLFTNLGKAILIPEAFQRFRELSQADLSTLFLGLAAWHTRPLVGAHYQRSPYMPRWWVNQFLEERDALSPGDQLEYFNEMVKRLRKYLDGEWVTPLLQFGVPNLNQRGAIRLVSFIDMFLRARSEAQTIENLTRVKQRQDELKRQRQSMPSIIQDIEGIPGLEDMGDPPSLAI